MFPKIYSNFIRKIVVIVLFHLFYFIFFKKENNKKSFFFSTLWVRTALAHKVIRDKSNSVVYIMCAKCLLYYFKAS